MFPFASARCWQGVCQSPGQELLSARRVKVWEITARMPAAKALGPVLGRDLVMPLPLRLDDLIDVGLHAFGLFPKGARMPTSAQSSPTANQARVFYHHPAS